MNADKRRWPKSLRNISKHTRKTKCVATELLSPPLLEIPLRLSAFIRGSIIGVVSSPNTPSLDCVPCSLGEGRRKRV